MWRFAPDVDPTTPEIYVAQTRFIATPWGTYRTSPSRDGTGLGTSGTQTPNGSYIFKKTDGTDRWVTGTSGKLWDSTNSGSSFTDRSGTAYSANATTQRWSMAQYGDITIACQLGDSTQSGSTGSNFANLGGSPPKASHVCVVSNAVILANYNDGTAYGDGWWASDIGSQTTWTPASSNQAANGRLLETPGAITCLIAFGGRAIAFKDTSVYEGQYVGRPAIWIWRVLHRAIGASGPKAAASDGQRLFFYGLNGAYIYDGAQFTRVDQGVEKYLQSTFVPGNTIDVTWSYKEQIFCINSTTTGTFANFCPTSNLWGVGSDAEPFLTGITTPTPVIVPPGYSRYIVGIVASNTQHYAMTGTDYSQLASNVRTGWIGSDDVKLNVTRVIPLIVPDGDYSYNNGIGGTYPAQLTYKTAEHRAATMAAGMNSPATISATKARFDLTQVGRWHEFALADTAGNTSGLQGGIELAGFKIVGVPAGKE